MSKHVCLPLLVLAASLATARDHTGNWIEVRSPHFIIVTNSGANRGRHIAAQFERMRTIFQQSYPDLEGDSESPVLVLAVRNKEQFRALQPSTYLSKKSLPVHGMFVRASDKAYILMRLDSEAGDPYRVVYHEYTHLFLSEAEELMPLWLNEGLAEFYQNTEIDEHKVLLGLPDEEHLTSLRGEKFLPLTTLFTVDEKSPYYLEEKKGSIFYAECWLLTHYLTLRDYTEKTSKVLEYKNLVSDNVDPVTAAVRVFGDLQKLQKTLEFYLAQRSFNHFETKVSTRIDESDFGVKSITSVQAKSAEADFLAASGRLEEARALLPAWQDVFAAENVLRTQQAHAPNKMRNETREDVPCPLQEILQGASERASEMVDNLQRFTALEEIEHIEFKKNGKPRRVSDQLFSYLAEVGQGASGAFWIEEYRLAKTQNDSPDMSDTGTAAFALIFHPHEIGNFEFRCEARTEWQGIPAWQLRFEESPDPSKAFHQIRINRSAYQLRFQGRAWIAADGYQILRLETELVAPVPQIHLQQEHLDITYGPVEFTKPKLLVWLPETAFMQINYHGHHYQRLHKFSHFQLFLVGTEQTVKEPMPGPGDGVPVNEP